MMPSAMPVNQTIGNNYKHQQGIALIGGLLFVLFITMISLTAMNATSFQEEMADNYKLGIQAFANAESGIRNAMALLNSNGAPNNDFNDELSSVAIAAVADITRGIFYTVTAIDNNDDADQNTDSDNTIILNSVGTMGTASRIIQVHIARVPSATPSHPFRTNIKALSWREAIN